MMSGHRPGRCCRVENDGRVFEAALGARTSGDAICCNIRRHSFSLSAVESLAQQLSSLKSTWIRQNQGSVRRPLESKAGDDLRQGRDFPKKRVRNTRCCHMTS